MVTADTEIVDPYRFTKALANFLVKVYGSEASRWRRKRVLRLRSSVDREVALIWSSVDRELSPRRPEGATAQK